MVSVSEAFRKIYPLFLQVQINGGHARYGRYLGIGGKHAENSVFLELNKLIRRFKKPALEANISKMTIELVCCSTFLSCENVQNRNKNLKI